jgi:hypothetical protein
VCRPPRDHDEGVELVVPGEPPGRGEHVAGDPHRHGRQAHRPRRPARSKARAALEEHARLDGDPPAPSTASPEPALPEQTSAQRQKALLAEGLTPRDVYAATVRETQTTYGQEVPTA